MPPVAYAIVVIGVLGGLLFMQTKRLGALDEKLYLAQSELTDARQYAESLVEAARKHDEELAAVRANSKRASAAVARIPDDGCLDRRLAPSMLDALRMRPADKDGKAAPAVAGAAAPSP